MSNFIALSIAHMAIASVHTAAPVPLHRTPLSRTLVLQVSAGSHPTPRDVWMETNFGSDVTTITHPDICRPFVQCITADPLSILVPAGVDVGSPAWLDVNESITVGPYHSDTYPVRLQIDQDMRWPDALHAAGVIGLAPSSPITAAYVIAVNTESLVHPDGTSHPGFSLTLTPANDPAIADQPGDIIIPLASVDWTVHGEPYFCQVSLTDGTATRVSFIPTVESVIEVGYVAFEAIEALAREAVGYAHTIDGRLYVPCLAEGEIDPLGKLTLRVGEEAAALHVNIRGSSPAVRARLPPAEWINSDEGNAIELCPTILTRSWYGYNTPSIIPHLIEGSPTLLLDSSNNRIVFRFRLAGAVPRPPMPVPAVLQVPSYTLPDPAAAAGGNTIEFVPLAAGSPPQWLWSDHRRRATGDDDDDDDDRISFQLHLAYLDYEVPRVIAHHHDTVPYAGEYALVGDGSELLIDQATSIVSLPITLYDGIGQKYRVVREDYASSRDVLFILEPVIVAHAI